MGSEVVQPRDAPGADGRPGGEPQDTDRGDQDGQDADLHIVSLDLLSQIFRRPSDHQAGQKNGHHDKEEHAVETRPDAAEDHFAQLDVQQGDQSAQGRKGIMHGVHGAAGSAGGHRGEEGGIEDP
ncbi:MAG: hypothetical protein A4E72_01028 [Syntrophus sp. PtaU1.Bin208]|nr:MAG: hypothetical protein A4E72_01028 [Syntrophus sp. PtaU1.Bin208]